MPDPNLTISVGRDQSNNITCNHDSVSKFHADIIMYDQNNFEIIDKSSSNGSYVNNRKIIRSSFQEDDDLRLGDYNLNVQLFVSKLRVLYNKNKTDFTEEFKELMIVFEEFQTKKNNLLKRPLKPLIIRIGLGLAVIPIIFLVDLDPNHRYAIIIAVGLLTTLGSYLAPSSVKKSEAFAKIKLEYEDKLVCPRPDCGNQMLKENLTYWKGKKNCPKCSAIYQT